MLLAAFASMGRQRSYGTTMAFVTGRSWIRVPQMHWRKRSTDCGRPGALHHGHVRTRALRSTMEAAVVEDEAQGSNRSSEARKTVVVARGKARLFW